MLDDTWRAIPDWEGYYEATRFGQVRSIDRLVAYKTAGWRTYPGRILRQAQCGEYLVVCLARNGTRVNHYVHRLVLETFDPPRPPGNEGLHGPAGKLVNIWPDNLRWGTKAENSADRLRDGTDPRGERNGRAKLTKADVLQIRAMRKDGVTQKQAAQAFDVSIHTIRDIDQNLNWAWL